MKLFVAALAGVLGAGLISPARAEDPPAAPAAAPTAEPADEPPEDPPAADEPGAPEPAVNGQAK